MIIAIDGPAASGKGTIGRRLACHLGYHYLDTGLLYRYVAKTMLDNKKALNDEDSAEAVAKKLDASRLPLPAELANYAAYAAEVAALPRVRAALLAVQRGFAEKSPGTVLDGRDIGTVIFPNADVKIFVFADAKVRARRRTLEARARGEEADEAAVLADILKRDDRDQNRPTAPLKRALDAVLLDNSDLDIEGGVRAAIDIVEAVRAGRQRV